MTTLTPDDGFYFGLLVFETLAIEQKTLIFPQEHMERLHHSLRQLRIRNPQLDTILTLERLREEAFRCPYPRGVLKIAVSQDNILFSLRENTYTQDQYRKGFHLRTSTIRRNETSPFTYHKTGNYGENILEKRHAHTCGFDEPIFLNSREQICEGATTNIFFLKNGRLFTPAAKCGLLKGIIREYLNQRYPVTESVIYPAQIPEFDEIFLTNSLLGIMPVASWDGHIFPSHEETFQLLMNYQREILTYTSMD
ncbi:MAG TPA: aminotransferase class IV [Candidatus Blautia intestinigallinarum]|nr:aminotransferase class IV [Candidatus Blautia intestinigallinarum]